MMWRVTQWLAVLWPPKWLYSWRRARHAMREFEAEYAPLEFIGSMDLEAERTFPGWWPAPPVDPEPWRVQTAADLSPEALDWAPKDSGEIVLRGPAGWISGPCIDPGPGEAPSDPGPVRHSDLGPAASAVLDRYRRRFLDRWGFVAPAGWSVTA